MTAVDGRIGLAHAALGPAGITDPQLAATPDPELVITKTGIVLPVGHYLGANHLGDDSPATHVVRVGWQLHEFDDDQFIVWGVAHGMPEGSGMRPWTAADAVGAARVAGVLAAADVLEELIRRRLVAQVDPGEDAAARRFAGSHRVRGLLRGIGRDDEGRHLLGVAPGQPAVAVDTFAFEVWKWAPHCDDLWHLGQILGAADPDAQSPAELMPACLAAAQVLVAHGAAFVDESDSR